MSVAAPQEHSILGFEIGGLTFSLHLDRPLEQISLHPGYQPFLCHPSHPHVAIDVLYEEPPHLDTGSLEPVFDSGSLWALYRDGEEHVVTVAAPATGEPDDRVAVFSPDFTRGRIYRRPARVDGLLPNPLENPLFQLLMICLLGRERGLLVHACGVDEGGMGVLFAGESGAGKSTMASQYSGSARILCDDRIIIRREGGKLMMHGTPWHGDLPHVSRGAVPLSRLFFLQRKHHTNRATPVTGGAAAAMLLARSFAPHWSEEAMGFTLEMCSDVVQSVRCAVLDFEASASAIRYVRCAD